MDISSSPLSAFGRPCHPLMQMSLLKDPFWLKFRRDSTEPLHKDYVSQKDTVLIVVVEISEEGKRLNICVRPVFI